MKHRNPWIAVMLSCAVAGLGQLYNGRPRRAALLGVVYFVLLSSLVFLSPDTRMRFALLWAVVALAIGLQLYAVVDAFIQARRAGVVELRRYNRWFVYLGITLLLNVATVALREVIRARYETFNSASVSGEPTLLAGDSFFAVGQQPFTLQRGDVILFTVPHLSRATYVKRLVGLPGDRVQIRSGQLFINGAAVNRVQSGTFDVQAAGKALTVGEFQETLPDGRSYRALEDYGPLRDTPEYVVPADNLFVLGDNRGNSLDSRFRRFGFVPIGNVVRKATYIYWSRDLSRIGRRVD